MCDNFVKYCLTHGATIYSLEVPKEMFDDVHVALCNPSIFIDNNRIRLVVRNVNYALWSSDDQYKFTSPYGPLCYITEWNDNCLRTRNFLGEITENGFEYKPIDMSNFDVEPIWEFIGLEDARLVRWDGKLYITGVRRDTNTEGQGRMELSEITEDGVEISRVRIKAPGNDDTYCEKNWMPILDMPYHYMRWVNPLQIVKVDPETGDTTIVVDKVNSDELPYLNYNDMQMRGSSQVVNVGDYHVAITHLCELWFNEKNQKSSAGYWEQILVWDKDWNLIKATEPLKFGNIGIEFTNGMAYQDGVYYIPFALQDNMAFLLTVNEDVINNFVINDDRELGSYILNDNVFLEFFDNPTDSYKCENLGDYYFNKGYYAAAVVCYERASEYNTYFSKDDLYVALFKCGLALSRLPNPEIHEMGLWLRMIELLPNRSEGYLMMAKYCFWRDRFDESRIYAKLAYNKNNYKIDIPDYIHKLDTDIILIKSFYFSEDYLHCEDMVNDLLEIEDKNLLPRQRFEINNFIIQINNNKANKYRVL